METMIVLCFTVNGRKYLLHDGKEFQGGNSMLRAEQTALENSSVAVCVGGFQYLEVTKDHLAFLLGIPIENPVYSISQFSGGIVPFFGVEVVEKIPPSFIRL